MFEKAGRKMGDRYNRVQNQSLQQKNIFLPMLCSNPTIKDVRLPKCDRDRSEPISRDPLSPRIGCMGQVKRNNRVAGLPISHRLIITAKNTVLSNKNSKNVNVSYLKLKKFLSSKNLLASASPSTTTASTSTSTSTRSNTAVGKRRAAANCGSEGKKGIIGNEKCNSFSIVDLDPPLPVIKTKRDQKGGTGEGANLWKRRSGGVVLQSLNIQQTQLSNHRLQITTV